MLLIGGFSRGSPVSPRSFIPAPLHSHIMSSSSVLTSRHPHQLSRPRYLSDATFIAFRSIGTQQLTLLELLTSGIREQRKAVSIMLTAISPRVFTDEVSYMPYLSKFFASRLDKHSTVSVIYHFSNPMATYSFIRRRQVGACINKRLHGSSACRDTYSMHSTIYPTLDGGLFLARERCGAVQCSDWSRRGEVGNIRDDPPRLAPLLEQTHSPLPDLHWPARSLHSNTAGCAAAFPGSPAALRHQRNRLSSAVFQRARLQGYRLFAPKWVERVERDSHDKESGSAGGREDFRASPLFSQSHAVNQIKLGAPLLSHKNGFLELDRATKTETSNSTTTSEKRNEWRKKLPAGGKPATESIVAVKSATAGWTSGLEAKRSKTATSWKKEVKFTLQEILRGGGGSRGMEVVRDQEPGDAMANPTRGNEPRADDPRHTALLRKGWDMVQGEECRGREFPREGTRRRMIGRGNFRKIQGVKKGGRTLLHLVKPVTSRGTGKQYGGKHPRFLDLLCNAISHEE
ncbi:hypothetical protein PR048_024305 [Dryococelus australis]|uniref:Uncharacterized protein n=1 Tax=Dryococelus australis TaxID=614101 RepID=A0ABQ9GNA9_9NEOP|nr:hypothetical protein PR048_024305 [Dryococelus australis]